MHDAGVTIAREPDEASMRRIDFARSLPAGAHIHISGVCGSGTSAVLSLLKQRGFYVTGSDKAFYPPMGDVVRELADEVYEGYHADNLAQRPALVVIGNALSRGNPEVELVLEQGLPFASMPEIFNALLIGTRQYCPVSIVVAGTHGKTTTSAAAATLLDVAGRKPGYFIGGIPLNLPGSIRAIDEAIPVEQRVVVLEGDEYDSAFFAKYAKFQCYRPDIAIVTSVEFDHGDIYSSIEEIETEFTRFVRRVPETGIVLVCDGSERTRRLAGEWQRDPAVKAPVVFYGSDAGSQYRLAGRRAAADGAYAQRLRLSLAGVELEADARLSGEHNALNLLAAAAAAVRLGCDPAAIGQAIAAFSGVKRRQQVLADIAGVRIVEDFAHHPTAVRATLAGLHEAHPGRRIIAVFEPRSNTSRRAFFQDDYAGSFEAAQLVVLQEVSAPSAYHGTSQEIGTLDVPAIASAIEQRGISAACFRTVNEIQNFLLAQAKAGDLIVLMSNGEFGGLPQSLPRALSDSSGKPEDR